MTLRDDHLRIALGTTTIVLPAGSRQALIARLRPYEAMRDVRELVERTRPPEVMSLTAAQKASLLRVLDEWETETGGQPDAMPPGIPALRDGLRDHPAGDIRS